MRRIVDSEDGKHIIAEFKDLIRRSYGKRDGDRFLKSQDIWEDFASTEAFSQLLYDICTDTDQAIEFWNGLIPKDLDKVAAELKARAAKTAEQITPSEVTPITEAPSATPRTLTQEEVAAMDSDELKAGLADGRYKLSS
jgi:hypothetical protein